MIIRSMTEDDLPTVLNMLRLMHIESTSRDLAFSIRKMAAMGARFMIQDDGCALVAEHEGKPAGVLWACEDEPFFSEDRIAKEYIFYVLPSSRGSRAFAKLLRAYIDWGKTRPVKWVCIGAHAGVKTESVGKLYGRYGFKLHGVNYFMEVA